MKRIELIIRPIRVSDVCAALDRSGRPGIMISAAECRGKQKGWVNQVRGMSFNVNLLAQARVEVVAKDEDVDTIIEVIREALSGEEGDGTIFVHDIAHVIRIETNKSGVAALEYTGMASIH
jgi:nitrogen regulatory protein PII